MITTIMLIPDMVMSMEIMITKGLRMMMRATHIIITTLMRDIPTMNTMRPW
ncbi:MAG: hypothetical protein WD272_06770 [Balneolales bacterium]